MALDERCRYCGEETTYYVNGEGPYYRIVGIYYRGVYDGTLYYACGFCDMAWQRWPNGHPLNTKAGGFIDEHNRQIREGASDVHGT